MQSDEQLINKWYYKLQILKLLRRQVLTFCLIVVFVLLSDAGRYQLTATSSGSIVLSSLLEEVSKDGILRRAMII